MAEQDICEPQKKKVCLSVYDDSKRKGLADEAVEGIKRLRVSPIIEAESSTNLEHENRDLEKALAVQRRKNFMAACERISYDHFSDHRRRFLLLFPPSCAVGECIHNSNREEPSEIASYAREAFRIDYKSQMWCDALHGAQMALRPDAFLSPEVLQSIVEIILNAHHDRYSGFTIPYLLDRSHQTLSFAYRTHPPCLPSVRKCYKNFLVSPLSIKDGTLSDRKDFASEKGLLKYCISRLEYELKINSKDGPLIDRNDYVTEEMRETIKGLQWQKDKLDIFETLNRTDRIKRLMIVLKSLVELLTADLSIWLSRHTHNQGRHIMRSHRPLLTVVLWSDNILYTGAVNNNCRQIMSLFVQFVSLGFPEKDIEVMTQLLNSMIQTFYICETNSSGDYPNTGKYCTNFALEFFKALKDLPMDAVIKVLIKIQPSFMRHLVGLIYVKDLLKSNENDILVIVIEFLENKRWKKFFEESSDGINVPNLKKKTVKKVHRIYGNFSRIIKAVNKHVPVDADVIVNVETYPKAKTYSSDAIELVRQEQIISIVFVTLDAYLDAYSVEKLQEKLDQMDNHLFDEESSKYNEKYQNLSYTLSEQFYKTYRSIYQNVKEIKLQLNKLKSNPEFEYFKRFETLNLLGF